MPQVREFDTPALSLRPTETGIETVAGNARRRNAFTSQQAGALEQLGASENNALRSVGRGLGSGIQAAGDAAVNYKDHTEISTGGAKFTELMRQKSDEWNAIASDPKIDVNDPTIKQKFMQDNLEPALEQFKDGSGYFTTEKSQDFAEHAIQQFRRQMDNDTSADMAKLAAIRTKVNAQTTINSLSSMVASDPSKLDFALSMAEHTIGSKVDSSPTMDATTKASVRGEIGLKANQDIVKSAVIGMIQKNPNVDLDAIQKKYGDYINGAEMKMFQKTAQVQSRADLLQQKQLETYQRQQIERAANDAFTKSRTDNISADDNGRITINPKIVKDALEITKKYPEAGSTALDTTIKFVEAQQDKSLKVYDDTSTVRDLSDRMFSPDHPTTELDLMKARADRKISDQTFSALHPLVKQLEEGPLKEPAFHDTINAVKGELILSGVGLPGKDIKGEANYAKWAQSFLPQYLSAKRAGALPSNALDVTDPNSMISQSMKPFHRDLNARINDYLSVLGTADATEGGGSKRTFGGVPVPAPLAGIAAIRRNPATGQWRDETTGKVYDKDGREVSK